MKLLILIAFLLLSPRSFSQSFEQDWQDYQKSSATNPKFNDFVRDGFKAYHENSFETAHKKLYQAFNLGCESPLVLFKLALLSENSNSYYTAVDMYRLAKVQFQKHNKNHRYAKMFLENYGRALYLSGKKNEALPILKAASKKTKSFWLLKMLGMFAIEEKDSNNALSYFERAIRVAPDQVSAHEMLEIYILLGRLFQSQGEFEGAKRNYEKALQIMPTNVEAQKFLKELQTDLDQQKMRKTLQDMIDDM